MNHPKHRSLIIALMLITLAGCSTTVKAPFGMPLSEWTQPAATDGLLAQIAAAVSARAQPLGDQTGHSDAGVSGFKHSTGVKMPSDGDSH